MARSPITALRAGQLRGPLPEVEFGYTPGWDLVVAHTRDGQLCGRVVCMSPQRAIVVIEQQGPHFIGELRFPAASKLAPIAAEQVGEGWRHTSGDYVVEIVLAEGSFDDSRALLGWLRECVARGDAMPPQTSHVEIERIDDPERIKRVLAMLHGDNAKATVRGTGPDALQGVPLRASFDRRAGLLVEWDRARPLAPPLHVSARGYDSLFELVWPDSVSFKALPAEIVRVRRRQERRAEAPRRAQVRFSPPHQPELQVTRALLDMSIGGLGFTTDTVADGLYPGLALRVTVGWKAGLQFEFDAIVRHCTRAGGGSPDICGLSLLPVDADTEAGWHEQITTLLHPRTRTAPAARELWDLYCESGYFELSDKTSDEFEPLRRAFDGACTKLAGHPEVGAHFGLWELGRLEVAASQIEAWSGSWLLFQVARTGEQRPLSAADDDVLRDLYIHAYEHVQRQPEARYLLTYVQDVARFSRLCQYDFGVRRAAEHLASVTSFRAVEITTALAEQPSNSDPSVEITVASAKERGQSARWVAKHRPGHYRRATGLDTLDFELGTIVERWAGAGFDRGREVLVARTAAGPVAALVLEAADDGLHLFRLLDVARLIPLADGDPHTHLPALIDAARRWYASRGKRAFVYFEEQDPTCEPTLAGSTDLGLAYAIAIPVESLPELLEHIYEITAPK
jgi:hypothetical protein